MEPDAELRELGLPALEGALRAGRPLLAALRRQPLRVADVHDEPARLGRRETRSLVLERRLGHGAVLSPARYSPGLSKSRDSSAARTGIEASRRARSGVRAASLDPQAVEHRHADRADEVPVRAAAARLRVEVEPELAPVRARRLEQPLGALDGSSGGRSSRRPARGSPLRAPARAPRAPAPSARGPRAGDPHVNVGLGLRGDDVLRRAPDDADVHRDAALVVVQPCRARIWCAAPRRR